MVKWGDRRPLPIRRRHEMRKIRVGGQAVYIGIGEYADGTLGEVFVDVSRPGTMARDLLRSTCIAMSMALQHGTPLEDLLDAMDGTDFPPNGPVAGSAAVDRADSIIDALVQELRAAYLGGGE